MLVIHKSIEEQRQELELLLEKISSKESKLSEITQSGASAKNEVIKLRVEHENKLKYVEDLKVKLDMLHDFYEYQLTECSKYDKFIDEKSSEVTKSNAQSSRLQTELKALNAKASKLRIDLESEESKLLWVLNGITLSDIIQIQVNAMAGVELTDAVLESKPVRVEDSEAISHLSDLAGDFLSSSREEVLI